VNKTTALSTALAVMTVVALIGWTKIPGRAQEPQSAPVATNDDTANGRPALVTTTNNHTIIAFANGNFVIISSNHGQGYHSNADGSIQEQTKFDTP